MQKPPVVLPQRPQFVRPSNPDIADFFLNRPANEKPEREPVFRPSVRGIHSPPCHATPRLLPVALCRPIAGVDSVSMLSSFSPWFPLLSPGGLLAVALASTVSMTCDYLRYGGPAVMKM